MIQFFRMWCERIIVAVIISIIIEAIIPEGSYKKYVKVVVGIYIIFTILNPVLQNFDNFSNLNIVNSMNVQTSTEIADTENIKLLYANSVEEMLKSNIENEFGYTVINIKINYDKNYENIEKIFVKLKSDEISCVEKVEIGNNNEEQKNEYSDLKKYIAENFDVDVSLILIGG